MKKFTKRDFFLITFLSFLGLILGGVLFVTSKAGAKVVIKVDSQVVESLPLDIDTEYEIKTKTGVNTVVVENHKAYIVSASCPDKVCMNMGKIDKSGQSIVCLPNRVILQIEGEDNGIDTYTGRLP